MSRSVQAIIAIIIVAAIAVGAGVAISHNNKKTTTTPPASSNQPTAMPPSPSPNSSSSQTTQTEKVSIVNMSFSPNDISVKKGTTVTWTNNDSTAHTVTSDSGTELSSGTLSPGKTYDHMFNTTGTFKYHCSIHPFMTGSVTVTE